VDGKAIPVGLRDELLATAVLRPLLERIAASTERVRALAAALERPSLDAHEAERSCAELAEEAREADTLGWLLGCVAGGLGAELLLDRHEPRAIALALALVAQALSPEDGRIALSELPDVTPQGGWRLAWALAGLVWRAGLDLGSTDSLAVSFEQAGEEACLVATRPAGRELTSRALEVARELRGTRLESHPGGWSWRFPSEWLEVPS
jgi:hypothetical protein